MKAGKQPSDPNPNDEQWAALWHRHADGEALSDPETQRLVLALQCPQVQAQAEAWQALGEQLPALLRVDDWPPTLARTVAADIALSARLSTPELQAPELPFSLGPNLSKQIAGEQAARTQSVRTQAVRTQAVRTELNSVQMTDAQAQIALYPESLSPEPLVPDASHGSGVLAGLGAMLGFGGLGVLAGQGSAAGGLGVYSPLSPQAPDMQPVAAQLIQALASPVCLLGLGLLVAISALLVWRPVVAARRQAARVLSGLLLLGALLTLPAVWQGVRSLGQSGLTWGPLLLASAALQMGLLLHREQARPMVSEQRPFPLPTLGAGLLTVLGLTGLDLGLALLLGWLGLGAYWAMPPLAALLLAVVVGLAASLLSLGRDLAQRTAAPRWVGTLASLGIYGVSFAMPPLAAVLLLLLGSWGLGSLVTGKITNATLTEPSVQL